MTDDAELKAVRDRGLSEMDLVGAQKVIESLQVLRNVYLTVLDAINLDLLPSGLELGEVYALLALTEAPNNRLGMTEIADRLHLPKSTATYMPRRWNCADSSHGCSRTRTVERSNLSLRREASACSRLPCRCLILPRPEGSSASQPTTNGSASPIARPRSLKAWSPRSPYSPATFGDTFTDIPCPAYVRTALVVTAGVCAS